MSGVSRPVAKFDRGTGELLREYMSLTEAAAETGCGTSGISNCCRGRQKRCGGYIWKYLEPEPETEQEKQRRQRMTDAAYKRETCERLVEYAQRGAEVRKLVAKYAKLSPRTVRKALLRKKLDMEIWKKLARGMDRIDKLAKV